MYENGISGNLELVNGVMIKVFGMGQIGENRMCLSVHESEVQNEHLLKEMDFVKKEDRWVVDSITDVKWCGNDPNPFEPAISGQEGVFKYEIRGGAATLTKYNGGEADSVVIPDTLGGCPVKTIGEGAFYLAEVEKVVIPESVTAIKAQAFASSKLAEIAIPKGVSAIGDKAFSTITLKKVSVDAENENFVSEGNTLFTKDKKELVLCTYSDHKGTFSVPEGVTAVRSHAFLNCIGITKIVLPNTLEAIGDGAFAQTGITEIIIPDHVTYIGDFGFEECHDLRKVYYMGNAPEFQKGISAMGSEFTVYFLTGTTGWDKIEWDGCAHEQMEKFYNKGGVTGDQIVDLSDAKSALKIALSLESTDTIRTLAADIDGDGMVSLKDVQKILRAALNLEDI